MENLDKGDAFLVVIFFLINVLCAWPNWSFHIFALKICGPFKFSILWACHTSVFFDV